MPSENASEVMLPSCCRAPMLHKDASDTRWKNVRFHHASALAMPHQDAYMRRASSSISGPVMPTDLHCIHGDASSTTRISAKRYAAEPPCYTRMHPIHAEQVFGSIMQVHWRCLVTKTYPSRYHHANEPPYHARTHPTHAEALCCSVPSYSRAGDASKGCIRGTLVTVMQVSPHTTSGHIRRTLRLCAARFRHTRW